MKTTDNLQLMKPAFKRGDLVEFEHGKDTFLLQEGWHTGRVTGVHDNAVTVRVLDKQGRHQDLPIRDVRLRHAQDFYLPADDDQQLGEIPNTDDYAHQASESVRRSVRETVAKYGIVSEDDLAGLAAYDQQHPPVNPLSYEAESHITDQLVDRICEVRQLWKLDAMVTAGVTVPHHLRVPFKHLTSTEQGTTRNRVRADLQQIIPELIEAGWWSPAKVEEFKTWYQQAPGWPA